MSKTGKTDVSGGIRTALTDRNFRVYSAGSIASWTSYFVQLVAVSWLTWELTGSTVWLALIALMDIVPSIILLPFTGAFADRCDRYKIMIRVCILCLVQSVALAACSWTGVLGIGLLAILELIHAVIIAFMVPAMYGTLPRFVSRQALPSAIALSSSYVQIAIFAGPAFAGGLISAFSVSLAFLFNALGYLVLTLAFLALKTPDGFRQDPPEPGTVFGQIRDGVVYLVRDRQILALLVLGVTVNAITVGTYHMLPAYSERVLDMGVIGMALVLSVEGIGATAAALWIAQTGGMAMTTERVFWSVLVAIIAAAAIICVANLYLALVLSFILGVAAEVRKTGTMTIVQMTVEENQRGRVMGTWYLFSQMAAGIGTYGIGQAADLYGLQIPTLSCAVVCVVVWLCIYLNRDRFFP